MLILVLSILGGLALLAFGGEVLVRGAVAISHRLGLSNLVTGLIIVGAATSMPEMVASVQAALLGSPEIAWGNIAGSNIANSLLILGATALIAPIVLTGLGRRDAVVGVGAALVLMLLGFAQIGSVWIGVGLLGLLAAYLYWRYNHPVGVDEDDGEGAVHSLPLAIVLTLAGVGLLIGGGLMLVDGAIALATIAGLSETVIGLTIVAIGTSLPELAASIVAAFRGKPGLAVGNVLGSNIFNILLIGGATMTIAPVPVPDTMTAYDLPFNAAVAVLLWVLLATRERIGRWLGAALLTVFAINTAYLLLG